MSFSGTTTGAIAECAGTISASVEGVFASARAICSLTGAITASAKAETVSTHSAVAPAVVPEKLIKLISPSLVKS